MARPGAVDAAIFGLRGTGISRRAGAPTLTFRSVGAGDPAFAFGAVTARDAANRPLELATQFHRAGRGQRAGVSLVYGNFPNPFNPKTTVAYGLSAAGHVSLKIYGVDGRHLRTLVDAQQTPGRHEAVWDGRDDSGRQLASGAYLARMEAADWTQTIRLLLLK